MDENFIVTLINPFSRVKGRRAKENSVITLPALEPRNELDSEIHVFRATSSADPISNAKDCTVAVIYGYLTQLAFIRLHKDTTWTFIYAGTRNVQDLVYVEDRFFAINDLNQLESFAVTPQFNPKEEITVVAEYFEQEAAVIKRYLVELSDRKELIMVQRYTANRHNIHGKRFTTKIELYKLDADKYKWTKINSLGGAAIFLGENSSISLLASEVLGCLPDCIYFVHDYNRVPCKRPRDFGLYNVKTEKFLPIDDTQAATLIKMSNQTPIWIVPNIKL
ncbi:PREDICTED: putative F-box protein At5g55150 [Fragaria vesca subsp. vesca]|uniref:putative F-box protein At5g55150 n=1 Tax=Fragaria vesca subsp. vesca TaxID=101020 RepID=UPI0002C349FB|nr:PREDICTED: putative F-box protein At5g55150 [Fragaria vesca subsp. vesca]